MFVKIALLCAFAANAAARPDERPRAYSYQEPAQAFAVGVNHDSDSDETYQAPQPTQIYRAPAPVRTYQAPSEPAPSYAAPDKKKSEEHEPLMPFDFGYIVDDDDTDSAYGHKSNSDGQQVTGQYRVLLPDGRTQIVTYTADREHGYRADVTYEGEARPWVPPQSSETVEQQRTGYA